MTVFSLEGDTHSVCFRDLANAVVSSGHCGRCPMDTEPQQASSQLHSSSPVSPSEGSSRRSDVSPCEILSAEQRL